MAYGFRRRYRRRFRRPSRNGPAARAVSSLVSRLKYWDSTPTETGSPLPLSYSSSLQISSTWNAADTKFYCINTPVNGTGVNNRISTQILVKSIHFRCHLMGNTSGNPACVRFMFLVDARPVSTVNITDILQGHPGPTTNIITPMGFNKLEQIDRFKVLCDKRVCMPNVMQNVASFRMVDINLKCNVLTQFGGTGTGTYGNVGDIYGNGIYLLVFSDQSTNPPSLSEGVCRIRYMDN